MASGTDEEMGGDDTKPWPPTPVYDPMNEDISYDDLMMPPPYLKKE